MNNPECRTACSELLNTQCLSEQHRAGHPDLWQQPAAREQALIWRQNTPLQLPLLTLKEKEPSHVTEDVSLY